MSKAKTGNMVTKDTWTKYIQSVSDCGFLDYIEANKDFVGVLDKILLKTSSFKEIKLELTELVKERKKFIKYASEHLP